MSSGQQTQTLATDTRQDEQKSGPDVIFPRQNQDEQLVGILEKQKQDLVVRLLRKHEEAEANRAFIDRVMSNLSDLFIILDHGFNVAKANAEFFHILEYGHDINGMHLRDLVPPETIAELESRLKTGKSFHGLELTLLNNRKEPVPVLLRGTHYRNESGETIYILVASDRRDFYDLMERMSEVQNQLIHSGRLASLGEMAAGIGHEITQPLNTVLLLARNGLKTCDSAEPNLDLLRENLSVIIDRVNHASSIVQSLRIFASKAREETTPVQVNAILNDVLGFLENQLSLSGITVSLSADSSLPRLLAHEVRLEQVFLNLIRNSIQAMAETDEPLLEIVTFRHQGLDSASLKQRNFVAISITDNGEGIFPEHLDRLFDPFFTTREIGIGMGLGLSIVDRIVRGLGGHITVKSSPRVSTCFTVHLPEPDNASRQAPPGDKQ